jgi:hypothetical protein
MKRGNLAIPPESSFVARAPGGRAYSAASGGSGATET